jgi:hypothetical protein
VQSELVNIAVYASAGITVATALHLVATQSLRQQLQMTRKEADRDKQIAAERTENLRAEFEEMTRRAKERRNALTQMREVWGNQESAEPACHDLLFANLWVLEPEFVVQSNRKPWSRNSLGTIFKSLGWEIKPTDKQPWHQLKSAQNDLTRLKPDICGFFRKTTSVGLPYPNDDSEVFLIIELKKAEKKINRIDMDQAHSYASLFRRLPNTDYAWNVPIECLVIGHDISTDVTDGCMRWSSDVRSSITIRAVKYSTLLARAEQLCSMFLNMDDKL